MNREETIRILSDMLSCRCTPENIITLQTNEVFVFGTDPEGNHKSNAAKFAVEQFGAQMGKGEGFCGQSYAIPVHKHRTWKMAEAISRFIEFAKSNPEKNFLVLAVGCGVAGMDTTEVALMFEKSIEVNNVFLPAIFIHALKDCYEKGDSQSSRKGVSSYRYHGRWYGLMLCLGEQSGRDMKEKLKDKSSEVLTMLQISNEFPKDFKYVNHLLNLEKSKEQMKENLTEDEIQRDYILGAIEAKKVYLEGRKWERLLVDNDII